MRIENVQVTQVPTEWLFFSSFIHVLLEAHTLLINVLWTLMLNLENVHFAFAKIINDLLIEVFFYANW